MEYEWKSFGPMFHSDIVKTVNEFEKNNPNLEVFTDFFHVGDGRFVAFSRVKPKVRR